MTPEDKMTAQELADKAREILNHPEGFYLECPDCHGDKQKERVCELCGGQGCRNCNLGMIFTRCETCKGEGEIWVTIDE